MTFGSRALFVFLGVAAGIITLPAASAMDRNPQPAKIVAAARFGQISARMPKLGLVRRGGYTPMKDMVRPRFVGGMIDLYPAARNGFRLSVGNRYFSQINFWRESEQATNGLLYDPHMIRGGISAQQRVYRKWTPAALVGYDTEVAPGLVAGIEGGALFGRAINPGPRRFSKLRNEDSGMSSAGFNPVATVAVRYAF